MKPRLLGAALAAVVLAATPAAASTGWVKHRGHYVKWTTSEVRPRLDDPRLYVPYLLARAEAIRTAKAANDTYHAAQVIAARQAAAARAEAARRAAAARANAEPATHPTPPPSGGGGLHGLVCSFNWSCSIASCIVGRESGWNPRAYNPRSGSAGLMQIMPMWYRGRFDPFNPYANVSFGYHLYRMSGWSPWNGGQYRCF